MMVKCHTRCRVCVSPLPKPYLDLGEQPLANALIPEVPEHEPKFPLAVTLCEECGLSQLTVVVDPKVLYTHYRFASGTSSPWLNHCHALAEEIKDRLGESGFVIDIAANDGSQLQQFKGNRPWKVLGVEPSDVPTLLVGTSGNEVRADIPMIRTFWSETVANQIVADHGQADAIIAQNVLGHVDDCVGFLKGIKTVLKRDGSAIIEVPNVGDLIDNMAFDTIYHEHLSYWNGTGMERAASAAGLSVDRIEKFPELHGGTVRYWLKRGPEAMGAPVTLKPDKRPYDNFAERVTNQINSAASIISGLHNKKFLAWGASAKGAVMMNAIHNRSPGLKFPEAVIDQTPEKQGLLTPGVHMPVIPPPDDLSDIDVIWVLSWNWLERLKYEAETRGFRGKYLVTSPWPRLI
jgi:hypothetical protein